MPDLMLAFLCLALMGVGSILMLAFIAWLQSDRKQPCVMCSSMCLSGLEAKKYGRLGPKLPLCVACFDDDDRFIHAVAFAKAGWR